MSHLGHCGWGIFPPPKLPRCPGHAGAENGPASPSLLPLVLVAARPGYPSTGKLHGPPLVRKVRWYVYGSSLWPSLYIALYGTPVLDIMLNSVLFVASFILKL